MPGRLWGAVVASSDSPRSLPASTEERVAGFAELVADALASPDAREQLTASRARLVEAGDAERRRLERNLHDGAQARLVGLALILSQAEAKLDWHPEHARRLLARLREELALALDELRELARGIHPAILSDYGLGAALESLGAKGADARSNHRAAQGPAPGGGGGGGGGRLLPRGRGLNERGEARGRHERDGPRQKHRRPGAHRGARRRVGGAELGSGFGLRGLADRVDALGGRLLVVSPHGAGTTLTGEIPLS